MCPCCVVGVGEAVSAVGVCAWAEEFVVSSYDNRFYAWIVRKEAEGIDEVFRHAVGEGIVFARAVEGDEDSGCGSWGFGGDMGDADVSKWEGCV